MLSEHLERMALSDFGSASHAARHAELAAASCAAQVLHAQAAGTASWSAAAQQPHHQQFNRQPYHGNAHTHMTLPTAAAPYTNTEPAARGRLRASLAASGRMLHVCIPDNVTDATAIEGGTGLRISPAGDTYWEAQPCQPVEAVAPHSLAPWLS